MHWIRISITCALVTNWTIPMKTQRISFESVSKICKIFFYEMWFYDSFTSKHWFNKIITCTMVIDKLFNCSRIIDYFWTYHVIPFIICWIILIEIWKNWPHICKILKSILLDNFKQKGMSHLHPVTKLVANLHPVTKLRPISSKGVNWKSKVAVSGSFWGWLWEKTLCLGA